MKKGIYSTLVIALVPALLTSCTGSVNVSDLIVPTFSNDKKVNIGAWSWTVKNLNNTQLSGLKEAGFNLLIGTFNDRNDSADSGLLDRASEYDIGLILDKRPWDGSVPSYVDKENFLGYCVVDEPNPTQLQSLQTMKNTWDQSALKDKMFFINLNPSYSSNVGPSYSEYVRMYTEDLGLGMVSFDYYPLFKSSFTDEVCIREDWLYNFGIASYYARKNNVPLWYTLLTTEHNAGGLYYINPSAKDIEYQMYVALAFGTQYLIHYTMTATNADHLNPIIDKDGKFTDSYYDAKEAAEAIRQWDSVYMNFKNVGVSGVFGTKENTGLIDFLIKDSKIDEFNVLKSAKSDYDVIIGHFEDEEDNKGLVVTNLTNPYDETNATVTLTFNSQYKGVKIYSQTKEEVRTLNNNSIEIEVNSGSGLFVVPLKTK